MSTYRIFCEKDNFITSNTALISNNFGIDEVLELEKSVIFNTRQFKTAKKEDFKEEVESRILIQFNLEEIKNKLISGEITDNPRFFLNLKTLDSVELPFNYSLYIYPVSQSWDMGNGRKCVSVKNGSSWKYLDFENGTYWISGSTPFDKKGGGTYYSGSISTKIESPIDSGSSGSFDSGSSGSFDSGSSGSFDSGSSGSYDSGSSGSFDSGSSGSFLYNFCDYSDVNLEIKQDFKYQNSDLNVDVTSIVRAWLCGKIENNGFLITHDIKLANKEYGKLKFYSKDTNTIYSPYLDVKWKDINYNTGSLSPCPKEKIVYVSNLKSEYKRETVTRLNVFCREKYPIKTFQKVFSYTVGNYLPYKSFYSVKDAESEEVIIDFSEFTQLSCDENGNYFIFDMNGLPQERFYKIFIKVMDNNLIDIFEDQGVFKIIR